MNLFACLSQRRAPEDTAHVLDALIAIAEQFSPRYERVDEHAVVIDLAGLRPLFGESRDIADALRRSVAAQGMTAGIAVASTHTAARVVARVTDGVTVVAMGRERQTLAPLPIESLDERTIAVPPAVHDATLRTFTVWGLRTLGDVAALPLAALRARIGSSGAAWHAAARGQDLRPLQPTRPAERFETSLELEWPIDGLEPLSFVVTRLLEPLVAHLERQDRGAAVMHMALHLVTKETYWLHLDLPAPMRDVRTLRTLLLLRAEMHPPDSAIDRVTIVADPTPARIVQHTLFARAQPASEQVSTLVARLEALMGADRVGRPVVVDTARPGAFALQRFRTTWSESGRNATIDSESRSGHDIISAFREYRPPVPARVTVDASGAPVRIVIDRAGFEDGCVQTSAGPWRVSGAWWNAEPWDCEEWDVCLTTGTVYRLARDRNAGRWFLHAIAD